MPSYERTRITFRVTSDRFGVVELNMNMMSDSARHELMILNDSLDRLKREVIQKMESRFIPDSIDNELRTVPREDD